VIYRVIIAGGRDFGDPGLPGMRQAQIQLLYTKSDHYLYSHVLAGDELIIVSGKQRSEDKINYPEIFWGADYIGECYAADRGYTVEPYPAEWSLYGKRAGYVRNVAMGDVGDALIAFWDGKSKGTAMMIEIMMGLQKPVRIVRYTKV
jgi:hypothetical protein